MQHSDAEDASIGAHDSIERLEAGKASRLGIPACASLREGFVYTSCYCEGK